jgi:hypothetical protein
MGGSNYMNTMDLPLYIHDTFQPIPRNSKGYHLGEEYYQKWCGTTINPGIDFPVNWVDDSRDIVKHNIQELTPGVEKIKHKWKFWRK